MRQLMIVVLTVILACTGVSFAEEQAQCPGMTGHMRMMGSMMPMMHMTHTTAWDGMVYLLTPMKLEKLNSNLEVVASVEYDTIPCMMQQGEQEEATRPIPLGGETMTTVHGVHRRCMMSSMAVSADAQGVYVLRGMMMTVYDHDLNELRSKQVMTVPEDAGNCPMCRMMMQHMQQQGMMGRGMMMGGGMMRGPMTGHGTMMQGWSAPMERDLERGQVQMRYLPAQDMPGMVSFEVRVLDASMDEDEAAGISGSISPEGMPGQSMSIDFQRFSAGCFMGQVKLMDPGSYDLTLRVRRPYRADATVHYDVAVRR